MKAYEEAKAKAAELDDEEEEETTPPAVATTTPATPEPELQRAGRSPSPPPELPDPPTEDEIEALLSPAERTTRYYVITM